MSKKWVVKWVLSKFVNESCPEKGIDDYGRNITKKCALKHGYHEDSFMEKEFTTKKEAEVFRKVGLDNSYNTNDDIAFQEIIETDG